METIMDVDKEVDKELNDQIHHRRHESPKENIRNRRIRFNENVEVIQTLLQKHAPESAKDCISPGAESLDEDVSFRIPIISWLISLSFSLFVFVAMIVFAVSRLLLHILRVLHRLFHREQGKLRHDQLLSAAKVEAESKSKQSTNSTGEEVVGKGTSEDTARKTILVLHPNAINNGGGEKVLWQILADIPSSKYKIRIFCSDSEKKQQQWRNLISQYFGIRTNQIRALEFVNVSFVHQMVDRASKWPFTLLLQSLVSMLGFSFHLLLHSKRGDILLDSTGYPFVYPMAYAMGLIVTPYVHYPTISTDMLRRVRDRKDMYNNQVARSPVKSLAKQFYYRLFASFYSCIGSYCDVVMANSSWTFGHLNTLWSSRSSHSNIQILYPPVNVSSLKKLPLNFQAREKIILSVGQFRPEKNHSMQLKIFSKFLKRNPSAEKEYRLVFLGSCRHADDYSRVEKLKAEVKALELQNVDFVVDAPYDVLLDYLGRSFIGLHCMEDEHFGICVVEYQAAGLITLAHNSAGPRMDIVTEYNGLPTGYLASTEDEYVEQLEFITSHHGSPQLESIQKNARESTQRFSGASFSLKLSTLLHSIGIDLRPQSPVFSRRR